MTAVPLDLAEFEDDFDDYFTDDQPPPVGAFALFLTGCYVAVGVVVLLIGCGARALWRWMR